VNDQSWHQRGLFTQPARVNSQLVIAVVEIITASRTMRCVDHEVSPFYRERSILLLSDLLAPRAPRAQLPRRHPLILPAAIAHVMKPERLPAQHAFPICALLANNRIAAGASKPADRGWRAVRVASGTPLQALQAENASAFAGFARFDCVTGGEIHIVGNSSAVGPAVLQRKF
jgi:hypothetical protein